jgi:VCBS repeat-containing protein
MRLFSKNRRTPSRRSTNRRSFLRLESLEARLALATAPVAVNDFYDTLADQPLVVEGPGILANDTADAGATLAAGLFNGPANGTLELNEDGSFEYTPNAGFNGLDSFMYVANDGASDSLLAAVTIRVGNTAPEAANDGYTATEDTALSIDAAMGLLANDSDIEGDTLTPTITSEPLHGSLTVNADGSFTYTPEANYHGLDGFSYLVSDGTTTSEVASATIRIDPANDLPVGVNDEYTTAEDTPLTLEAPGVLVNDTDVDGDALSSILVIPPEHGTVTLGADGSLVYTPEANYTGVDGFSYLANDGSADSEATAVTINVTAAADAPIGTADAYATPEDTALVVDAAAGVLANDTDADGDALTAALVTGPGNGTLTLNADGSFEYLPNENWNGSDSFVYQSSDGTATSEPITVAITVCPINDAPAAAGEAYELDQDTVLTIDAAAGVLANDTDLDGDDLAAAIVTGPTSGTLTLNADGSFSYTPNAGFFGEDSFTYSAGDGEDTAEATVALTVNQVVHAPLPAIDNYSTGEDVPMTVAADRGVLANDINVDGGALTSEVVTGPAHGTLSLNSDGSFSYSPEANWHGTDSFTYKAINNGMETVSSANIVVEPLNDHPVAAADEFTISPEGGSETPNVLTNDSDIDGDALLAQLVSGPAHGTLSLNVDGTFTYTPAEDFEGDDSFSYQAFDGMAQSNVTTVTLHVEAGPDEAPTPENARPMAVNDTFTVQSGQALEVVALTGVLTNDSDPESLPLTASLFSGPLHGSLSLAADGSFSYTPTEGYVGMDAFMYRVSDGELWSPLAAVTIHVTPADEPDEAPVPDPDPAPTPCDPEPAPPIACDPEPAPPADTDDEPGCDVDDDVIDNIANGRHGNQGGRGKPLQSFRAAADSLFARGRWR